jgi:isoleucyl-tRNA synthetase
VDESAPESVHLTAYPEVHAELIDEQLERNIETVIRIKNLALNLRTQSKVKIRQPLSTLYVRPRDEAERRVLQNADYAAQILEEGNIKRLELLEDEGTLVKVRLKPDARKIGPRAGKHMKAITQALEQADAKQVLKAGTFLIELEGEPFTLAGDEINAVYEGPANLKCASEQGTFMALDTALTPELQQEGVARDFNRLVQDQRKVLNLDISDRIAVRYVAPPEIAQAIAAHEAYLRNELLAERLEAGSGDGTGTKLSLNGKDVYVSVTRV